MLFLSVAARLCLSTFAILHFWLILIIFFLMIYSGIACCGRTLCSLLLSVMTIAAVHAVSLCVARQSVLNKQASEIQKKIVWNCISLFHFKCKLPAVIRQVLSFRVIQQKITRLVNNQRECVTTSMSQNAKWSMAGSIARSEEEYIEDSSIVRS